MTTALTAPKYDELISDLSAIKDLFKVSQEKQKLPVGRAVLERPDNPIHVYAAIVEKVVDGNTLMVRIDLGFDVWVSERTRFRGINTAEIIRKGVPAGGIFAPSLSIGSAIGANIGHWMNVSVASCALIGMAAFLAGTIQAPITSFVIVFEMTGHHQMLLPIMTASLISVIMARIVGGQHLYKTLAKDYLPLLGLSTPPSSHSPTSDAEGKL